MVESGRIVGKKITELFQRLIQDKTIVSINVVGADFERLTRILAVQQDRNGNVIVVDPPDDILPVLNKAGVWRMRFMFIGPEQVEHIFDTVGGECVDGGLGLPFPAYVERLQRRRDFRMVVPPGSYMLAAVNCLKIFIDLLNVSTGGAFGAVSKHNMKGVHGSVLRVGQQLEKTGIFFPKDSLVKEQVVVVKRAVVRRAEKNSDKKLIKYGFEFIEIEAEQQKKLTQYLYHLQRLFLKRR